MALLAGIPEGGVDIAALAAEQGADGVLIDVGDLKREAGVLSQIVKAVGDVPWGAYTVGLGEAELSQLLEMGCDILVFDAMKTPSMVLWEERIGRVLRIDPSLNDSLIVTINHLPIDAVLIGEPTERPTVHWLMTCQRVANLVRKPSIVAYPSSVVDSDLKALWEVGVEGVLVRLERGYHGDKLAELRQAIEALPPRRRRGKAEAFLPYVGGIVPLEEEED